MKPIQCPPLPACMGGFKCQLRTSCRNYHAVDRREPSERLCRSGTFDAYAPVQFERPALALIQAAP